MKWLFETYALVPFSVDIKDDGYLEEIRGYLEDNGLVESLGRPSDGAEIYFTDGYSAIEFNVGKGRLVGIPFVLPYALEINLVERTYMGLSANKFIIDELLNKGAGFVCSLPLEIGRYRCYAIGKMSSDMPDFIIFR